MQFNHFASLLKESKPKFFRYWKFFSFFIPFIFIIEIARRKTIVFDWSVLDFNTSQCIVIIAVFFLMPLNWGLEAYKWHYLMERFNFKISFLSAYKTTLTGLAYSLVLPGGIGEYLGRAEAIPKGEAWKGAGVLSIARIAQLYATFLFGGLSLSFFLWYKSYYVFFFLLLLTVVLFWIVFIMSSRIALWLETKLGQQYSFARDILDPWIREGSQKKWVFILSSLRYLVFTTQFFLLLKVFGVLGSATELLSGISSAFLMKSFFPSFLDLGPRELAISYFFHEKGLGITEVLAASLLLWFINVLLPGLAGSLLIFRNFILDFKQK